jgi:hypothetical protein
MKKTAGFFGKRKLYDIKRCFAPFFIFVGDDKKIGFGRCKFVPKAPFVD